MGEACASSVTGVVTLVTLVSLRGGSVPLSYEVGGATPPLRATPHDDPGFKQLHTSRRKA
jgi:hypothetical protein